MKKRKVWRYTCDFCKKSGCNGGHIAAHEKQCFRNPDRNCPFCQAGSVRALLSIMDGITEDNEDEKLKQLKEAAVDCPACILSVLMQIPQQECEFESDPMWPGDEPKVHHYTRRWCSSWNYKQAADDYMREKRDEETAQYRF